MDVQGERYSVLREAVRSLALIRARVDRRTESPADRDALDAALPTARHELRISIATLGLLFTDRDLEGLSRAYDDLDVKRQQVVTGLR